MSTIVLPTLICAASALTKVTVAALVPSGTELSGTVGGAVARAVAKVVGAAIVFRGALDVVTGGAKDRLAAEEARAARGGGMTAVAVCRAG